jgi:hypothetical protein
MISNGAPFKPFDRGGVILHNLLDILSTQEGSRASDPHLRSGSFPQQLLQPRENVRRMIDDLLGQRFAVLAGDPFHVQGILFGFRR